jgi:hypothetical protein
MTTRSRTSRASSSRCWGCTRDWSRREVDAGHIARGLARRRGHRSRPAAGGVQQRAVRKPVSARDGAGSASPPPGRRVVSRCEALREMSATDPSSESRVSAPGDASYERSSVRELVLGALSENDRRTLLDGGTPSHKAGDELRPVVPGPDVPPARGSRRGVHAGCRALAGGMAHRLARARLRRPRVSSCAPTRPTCRGPIIRPCG